MTFVEFLVAVLVGWSLSCVSTWLVLLRVMRWLDRRMLPPAPSAKAGVPVPVKQVAAPLVHGQPRSEPVTGAIVEQVL